LVNTQQLETKAALTAFNTATSETLFSLEEAAQANFADVKGAEEALKALAGENNALAEKTATEAALLRTRVDKLRDELLALAADEADRRKDSITTMKASVAADLKEEKAKMAELAEHLQVRSRSRTGMLANACVTG